MPRKVVGSNSRPRQPAATPEGRESQMIAYATALAEKQLVDGTASAQVISHYLKLGSSREKLEQERLRHENELTSVKIAAIANQAKTEELYREALSAMRSYAGQEPMELEADYED